MKRLLTVLCVACIGITIAAAGVPDKAELTFSATAFKPNDGKTTYAGQMEFLFPTGPFVIGPSVSLFRGDEFQGGAFGVAGEWNLGAKCGPGLGAAIHKPTGDAADLADYTGELRAFFKCGTEHGFVKFTGRQIWSQQADGSRTDPDGTSIDGGVGLRW